MIPPKSAEYALMGAPKLDSILNNIRTTVSDVDIRRESEWDLRTEHSKARVHCLAAGALQIMNLIDRFVEQHAEE